MSSFKFTNGVAGTQPVTEVSSTQKHPLGTIMKGYDEDYGAAEFIYLKGVASTEVGSVVTYNPDDWTTKLAAANDEGPAAVSMAANTAATTFSWYQIQGKAVVKCGTVSDNGDVYATATAGTVDDAILAGALIRNAKFASANGTPSTGLAECEIARPWMAAEMSAAVADLTMGTNVTAATANGSLEDSAATNPSDANFNNNMKELGTKVNAILAALRTAGIIAS